MTFVKRFVSLVFVVGACGGQSEPAPAPENPHPAEPPRVAEVFGMPACDQFLVEAYSYHQCAGPAPAARDATMASAQGIVLQASAIAAASADERAAIEASCAEARTMLAEEIERFDCKVAVPAGDYVAAIRDFAPETSISSDAVASLAHCDGYQASLELYIRCQAISKESRDAAKAHLEDARQQLAAMQGAANDVLLLVDDGCIKGTAEIAARLTEAGCAP
jgi:hypothetical protein